MQKELSSELVRVAGDVANAFDAWDVVNVFEQRGEVGDFPPGGVDVVGVFGVTRVACKIFPWW